MLFYNSLNEAKYQVLSYLGARHKMFTDIKEVQNRFAAYRRANDVDI